MKIIQYHDPRRGERRGSRWCYCTSVRVLQLGPTLTIQSPPADVSSYGEVGVRLDRNEAPSLTSTGIVRSFRQAPTLLKPLDPREVTVVGPAPVGPFAIPVVTPFDASDALAAILDPRRHRDEIGARSGVRRGRGDLSTSGAGPLSITLSRLITVAARATSPSGSPASISRTRSGSKSD
jgi:hypothetical protein